MYGRIVLGIEAEPFDRLLDTAKEWDGVTSDSAVSADTLRRLCERYKDVVKHETGKAFPQDPTAQLRGAIEAVFKSWGGARAIAYRDREHISHELGTAVNVQAMVFGNRDDNSGTGVGFTRDPATGAAGAYGDFLVNAQGEDVVAGIRNTEPLSAMATKFPKIHKELLAIFDRLEKHYKDMCDTEFTIDQGKLYMLQTRVGKRTGAAALRMAVEMVGQKGRLEDLEGRGGHARDRRTPRLCPARPVRQDRPARHRDGPRRVARAPRSARRTSPPTTRRPRPSAARRSCSYAPKRRPKTSTA